MMWIFNRGVREALLLTRANEILVSAGKIDEKVATVQHTLDDLFKDLVKEVETLRVALERANVDRELLIKDAATKQAKIDELNGVIVGALELTRRFSNQQ